jgi:hypothetical protein
MALIGHRFATTTTAQTPLNEGTRRNGRVQSALSARKSHKRNAPVDESLEGTAANAVEASVVLEGIAVAENFVSSALVAENKDSACSAAALKAPE